VATHNIQKGHHNDPRQQRIKFGSNYSKTNSISRINQPTNQTKQLRAHTGYKIGKEKKNRKKRTHITTPPTHTLSFRFGQIQFSAADGIEINISSQTVS
jgi:hypothetical protein